MRKRIAAILFAVTLMFSLFAASAQASENLPHMIDQATILSPESRLELDGILDELSDEYEIDFVAASCHAVAAMSLEDYADMLYNCGYAEDAVFFIYQHGHEGEREIVIVRYGEAENKFSDNDCEKIINAVKSDFSGGYFYDGYIGFCDEAEKTMNPSVSWIWIPGCLIIGFVIAFIIMKIIASANKSVRNKVNAADYVRLDTLRMTNQREIFLYKNVKVIPRANSSTSSGNTRGGGRSTSSGKF